VRASRTWKTRKLRALTRTPIDLSRSLYSSHVTREPLHAVLAGPCHCDPAQEPGSSSPRELTYASMTCARRLALSGSASPKEYHEVPQLVAPAAGRTARPARS